MATIEKRNLAPVVPSTTLTETDRSRVYEMVRRHLADTLTGSQSYHPDGVQRDARSRANDLKVLIASMTDLQNHVDDPSNILGEAADDLKKIAEAIQNQIEENEPVDNIQMLPEFSPNTSDNNIIYVDPNPGPYSPPNPVAPSQRPRDFRVTLPPSQQGGRLRGIVSNQPMPDWPFPPPIFDRR